MTHEPAATTGRPPVAVELVEISAAIWRAVADVAPRPDQERFVAPITRYLCLGHYEQVWRSLAVVVDGTVVGHIMWAIDDADKSRWIGGVVIDAAAQGRGIGHAALVAMIDRLGADAECHEVALSYEPDNNAARKLYAGLGFVETGEMEDDEIVARRPVALT